MSDDEHDDEARPMSFAEIAKALNISPATAQRIAQRALAKLRQWLEAEGLADTD